MRRPRAGCAIAAARVLRAVPSGRRGWVLARMLAEARRAAAAGRSGRAVPRWWGHGSLLEAALRRRPGPEPALDDPEFRDCVIAVLRAL